MTNKIDRSYKIRVTPQESKIIQEIAIGQGYSKFGKAENIGFMFIFNKVFMFPTDFPFYNAKGYEEITASEFIKRFGAKESITDPTERCRYCHKLYERDILHQCFPEEKKHDGYKQLKKK